MAKIRSLPLGTYPSGTRSFGPLALPNGLAGFEIHIGRCTTATPDVWTNASTRIALDLRFSFDGGATYTPAGANGGDWPGGIATDRDGIEIPELIFTLRLYPLEPTHMQGSISVINGPVHTYLDVVKL